MAPRKNAQHAGTPAGATIPPATRKVTITKAAPKSKRGREADTIAVEEAEHPVPGKKPKTSVSNPKRQLEVENRPVESDPVVVTKRARTEGDPGMPEPQPPTRRSDRARTTTLAAPQKRKRRTKEEIAADKAKADADKKRQQELTQEKHRAMAQLDIDEGIDRTETATRTIRTFADLENNSGEEFVGYTDVEDSECELDGDAEDALALKEANKALQMQIKALQAQVDGGKKKRTGGNKWVAARTLSKTKTVNFAKI